MDYDKLNQYELKNRTYLNDDECIQCNIGGYCSGGCSLSASCNKSKVCKDEKKTFDDFVNKILFPRITELMKM